MAARERIAAFFLAVALVTVLAVLAAPSPAGATGGCSPVKPQVTWTAGGARWNSYHDYLSRMLAVDVLFSSTGGKAYSAAVLTASNSEDVTLSHAVPYALGDIEAGGSVRSRLSYHVPASVTMFRTNLYVKADDGCGNDYFYPQPLNTAARYSMTTSDNGYGQVSVEIGWNEAYDRDYDAVATVKYRLYPSNWWDSELPEYTVAGTVPHDGEHMSLPVSGLLPGRYYDFAVEVNDDDGVDGIRRQEDEAKLIRDGRFTVTDMLDNPHPGDFDEVRVRDFFNDTLFWYSAQGVWEYGNGYEYLFHGSVNSEYSIVRGKTAWQSAVDRSVNRIYIAGEVPRFDGGHNYRAMIGIIYEDADPPWLKVYSVPNTDDCNEFISIALDTAGNRLLVGERNAGTPLRDSPWPNGGGLWSVPLGTIGQTSTYGRVYQDPLNRCWDRLTVFGGRLYAQVNGSLISASLADIPPSGPMPPAAWRTEFPSGVFAMLVSPWHGLVVGRETGASYVTLSIFDGSSWRDVNSNRVFAGEGLYELADHRFVITRSTDYVNHHVQIASVTGEWENLGVFPGASPSYDYATDGNGSIYYGTVSPGKVIRIDYSP